MTRSWGFESPPQHNAEMAELADALGLGSSGKPWGFKSPSLHYIHTWRNWQTHLIQIQGTGGSTPPVWTEGWRNKKTHGGQPTGATKPMGVQSSPLRPIKEHMRLQKKLEELYSSPGKSKADGQEILEGLCEIACNDLSERRQVHALKLLLRATEAIKEKPHEKET